MFYIGELFAVFEPRWQFSHDSRLGQRSMNALYRIIAASLMGLIVHASLLATLPVVWCVSGHGHSALEPYFLGAHHGHHSSSAAKPSVEDRSTALADQDNSTDCIDTAAIAVFCSPAEIIRCIDLRPIFAGVPPLPGLASATTPQPSSPRSSVDQCTKALPLLHLRSVVLLI